MTQWEYLNLEVMGDEVRKINGEALKQWKGGFFGRLEGQSLLIHEFLKNAGEQSWEVVGICPASEAANWYRMILKRPI